MYIRNKFESSTTNTVTEDLPQEEGALDTALSENVVLSPISQTIRVVLGSLEDSMSELAYVEGEVVEASHKDEEVFGIENEEVESEEEDPVSSNNPDMAKAMHDMALAVELLQLLETEAESVRSTLDADMAKKVSERISKIKADIEEELAKLEKKSKKSGIFAKISGWFKELIGLINKAIDELEKAMKSMGPMSFMGEAFSAVRSVVDKCIYGIEYLSKLAAKIDIPIVGELAKFGADLLETVIWIAITLVAFSLGPVGWIFAAVAAVHVIQKFTDTIASLGQIFAALNKYALIGIREAVRFLDDKIGAEWTMVLAITAALLAIPIGGLVLAADILAVAITEECVGAEFTDEMIDITSQMMSQIIVMILMIAVSMLLCLGGPIGIIFGVAMAAEAIVQFIGSTGQAVMEIEMSEIMKGLAELQRQGDLGTSEESTLTDASAERRKHFANLMQQFIDMKQQWSNLFVSREEIARIIQA